MKERPILFSGPMVRAILEGRKTQTRRIVKPQPQPVAIGDGMSAFPLPKCPFGQPGDRLWVRETFQTWEFASNDPPGTVYRATDPDWESCEGWKWKPAIFMPRSASRITLEVTAVRVERLQDISPSDAISEGIGRCDGAWESYDKIIHRYTAPENSYRSLWQSINGTGSWAANPFVWVVEFKRVP